MKGGKKKENKGGESKKKKGRRGVFVAQKVF